MATFLDGPYRRGRRGLRPGWRSCSTTRGTCCASSRRARPAVTGLCSAAVPRTGWWTRRPRWRWRETSMRPRDRPTRCGTGRRRCPHRPRRGQPTPASRWQLRPSAPASGMDGDGSPGTRHAHGGRRARGGRAAFATSAEVAGESLTCSRVSHQDASCPLVRSPPPWGGRGGRAGDAGAGRGPTARALDEPDRRRWMLVHGTTGSAGAGRPRRLTSRASYGYVAGTDRLARRLHDLNPGARRGVGGAEPGARPSPRTAQR